MLQQVQSRRMQRDFLVKSLNDLEEIILGLEMICKYNQTYYLIVELVFKFNISNDLYVAV